MLDVVTFAVLFLMVLITAIVWLYRSSKVVTTIPGLSPRSKEDGNMGDIARAGSLHEFLMDLHTRFGPISGFWWGQTYVVSIASADLFKEHRNVFGRPPLLFKSIEDLIGPKSIQYANGVDGRNRRKIYDKMFAFDKMAQNIGYFDELTKKTEMKWMQKEEGDHIPLSEDCFAYTIHIALVTMFGDYYKDDKIFLQFKKAYDVVWTNMENTVKSITMDDTQKKHFDKSMDFLKTSIRELVTDRKNGNKHLQENLLIDVMIDMWSDEETLISDTMTYFVGGFHTSGNLLTWAIYYLATHKDVQDKLYEEIINVLGKDGNVEMHSFSQFQYMFQVIDETMRCAIIAPFAARFQDFDTELGGHKLTRNTPVIHALSVMMRDEKLWPIPNKFDPDRFSSENRNKISAFAFAPFGFAGKRKCPGYRFAYWYSVAFIAGIIRRFDISLCNDQVVRPVFGLITHPDEEIWVKVSKRE